MAEVLTTMIDKDGAGSWPPRSNHARHAWPRALRPYQEIYEELAPLIPNDIPSLNDDLNRMRVADFRSQFKKKLSERIDLAKVKRLLEAADAGQWDILPRDVYNAFYCCVASCRHAYRWATIPVVKIAQLETVLELPAELAEPWNYLQDHFGCASQSGNNTSSILLYFDPNGQHIYKINTGMPSTVTSGEEAFSRIFHDIEVMALPIYYLMVGATVAFARNDKDECVKCLGTITQQLRPLLNSYYNRLHNGKIALNVWLSHVQGFFAWGAGSIDDATGEFDKYDGLSGNQVLLFQALDAFLGIQPYLSQRDKERNVPARQRALWEVFEKHSFRAKLSEDTNDEVEVRIVNEFTEILKRLRMFRSAHRTRAKHYLSQPAPERLPMTAGKSLLKSDLEHSLQFLDEFMVRRLTQTV
ncbi:putative indoleamine 2,3-dioxygenase [Seiridium unicorne]|uniref:Indoleamine 2,3-dioxygenase n=1 Tax=Seiridium unicorne TaxID=138068 RepID=A0ABR2UPZ5_9PEZI